MVGIGKLKVYHYSYSISSKRGGFKRVGIEWGRYKQIKEKEKWVCTITTTFLISDLFPNFVSLPFFLSPKKIIPPLQTDFGDY